MSEPRIDDADGLLDTREYLLGNLEEVILRSPPRPIRFWHTPASMGAAADIEPSAESYRMADIAMGMGLKPETMTMADVFRVRRELHRQIEGGPQRLDDLDTFLRDLMAGETIPAMSDPVRRYELRCAPDVEVALRAAADKQNPYPLHIGAPRYGKADVTVTVVLPPGHYELLRDGIVIKRGDLELPADGQHG
jgi:hypothetical protein